MRQFLAMYTRRLRRRGLNLFRHAPPWIACFLGWWMIVQHLDDPSLTDAYYTYLPNARTFLEQGWAYLLDPESVRIVPLAYLWPALWGAEPTLVRLANGGLLTACIWFLWSTACLLGGYRAGFIALLLAGFNPLLPYFFPTEMTEPVFLFGLLGWTHAMARLFIAQKSGMGTVIQAGATMSITLLSRPILQLLVVLGLLACIAMLGWWQLSNRLHQSRPAQRAVFCVAQSLVLALALPALLVAKNVVVFGFWGLGTGSGGALYQGTHVLAKGAEPYYLGITTDVSIFTSIVVDTLDHLSIAADRVLRTAALWQIQSMSLMDSVQFHMRKLWWWLFGHPAESHAWRKYRFVMIWLLLACGLQILRTTLFNRRVRGNGRIAFTWLLIAMILFMLAQMLPVLYNGRYSVAFLDPWLILLAAYAVALFIAPATCSCIRQKPNWPEMLAGEGRRPFVAVICTGLLVAVMAPASYNLAKRYEPVTMDPARLGATKAVFFTDAAVDVQPHGAESVGEAKWRTLESPAVLVIHAAQDDTLAEALRGANGLWETELAMHAPKGEHCRYVEFAYQTDAGSILQTPNRLPLRIPVARGGRAQRMVIGANDQMRPLEPGGLRMTLHCPADTVVDWRGTKLLRSTYPWYVAEQIR